MATFGKIDKRRITSHGGQTIVDVMRVRLPTVRPMNSDYDPRDHRTPLQPIRPWMAYFNLLRTMFGAGMLGMPLAVSQAGIIIGPPMLFFTGMLIIHTHRMLLETLAEVCRQLGIPYVSYRYGFRLAVLHGPPLFHIIGNHGPTIIATFMFMSQLGICSVCVMLTTDSLRDMMDWQDTSLALLTLLFPYLLLEFFMKSLKVVSYVAVLGNVLNSIGMCIIVYHLCQNMTGDLLKWTTSPKSVMFSFGTSLFNLSVVGIILSVDKALHKPKQMTAKLGVVNVGIFLPTVIAVIFGTMGYCSFGTMEENILRSLPYDEVSSMVALGVYLVATAFSFPVQCYPAIATILEVIKYHDPLTPPSEATLLLIEAVGRPIFVVLCFIVCYCIPFQGPFVAFVGNMCTTMLSLVFPALMDICLRYPDLYGNYDRILLKNMLIICFGLLISIYGAIECASLIYVRILSSNSPNTNFY
ncbi:unnamed protein product [Chrysodeixis includens]|uniref:Amino acid transporter transmembrane domain-containing protein n=1 Tax=Chrysodeixis includens TaxID=689277 RepID=A0A9P0BRY7_CHRIL|nr:unnamed protein product [Chrysodeixis includens]